MTQGRPNKRQPKPPVFKNDTEAFRAMVIRGIGPVAITFDKYGESMCLRDPRMLRKLHNWLTRAIKYMEQNQ